MSRFIDTQKRDLCVRADHDPVRVVVFLVVRVQKECVLCSQRRCVISVFIKDITVRIKDVIVAPFGIEKLVNTLSVRHINSRFIDTTHVLKVVILCSELGINDIINNK